VTPLGKKNTVIWIESLAKQPLCDVPWLGTSVVLSDGRINFCCFSNAVAGNVNEESFEDIWNGSVMQRVRYALSEQRLPPECQSASCPVYRGDDLHYIFDRMKGPYRFELTKTQDPHAGIRGRFQGSELRVTRRDVGAGERLEVDIVFYYRGKPMTADLFVCVRYPDRTLRFLPTLEKYAVPFMTVEFVAAPGPLEVGVFERPLDSFKSTGDYEICAALFEANSNPNLLTNCYWSANKTISTGEI
jgi:hypothetical protein